MMHRKPPTELVAEIRAIAKRHDEAACTLIAVHAFAAAAQVLCLAIETLGGYFAGSAARAPSRASFLGFCHRYLPELGRTAPHVALAERPQRTLETSAEALHAAFRGGLFHDGERVTGIRCVDDKGRWMLSFEADGSARLNIVPFQAQLERGLDAYLADLARHAALAARAARRAAFLAQPSFVPRSGRNGVESS